MSNKKASKLVAKTMTAALVASAIVPVASVAAEEQVASISNVVLTIDDVQYDLSKQLFNSAIGLQIVNASDITSIKVDGKYYSKQLFNSYLGTGLSVDEALDALTTSGKEEAINPVAGKIENGKVVADEQEQDLTVESVRAINPTGVTVVVTELTEDIEGATVEVIDSEGNVREVQPVDLSAGETVVDFAFVDEVEEADLVGIWTVNGVEFNITLTQQLETFETTNSQLELYELLLELGIENVLSANAAAYLQNKADFLDELAANDEELTVSAIQQYVNDVNDSQVSETEKEAAFEAVEKALENNNLIELRAALAHPAFTKVNNAWIEDITELDDVDGYFTALDTASALNNADDVQNVIDTVNKNVINAHITALNIDTIDDGNGASETSVDKAKLNALKALIDAYAPVDQDGEFVDPTIADAYENIDIQIAVADVLSATTASTFKARVTTLAGIVNTASSTVIDLDEYVDANGKAYIDVIKDLNSSDPKLDPDDYGVENKVNTAAEIQAVIEAVNEEEEEDATIELFANLEKAIDAVIAANGNPTSTQKANYLAALNALGIKQVSSNKANVDEYIKTDGNSETADLIKTAVVTVTDSAVTTPDPDASAADNAIEDIQEAINDANLAVVKNADTEAGIIAALNVMEIKNVVEANAAAYIESAGDVTVSAKTIGNATNATTLQEAVNEVNKAEAIKASVKAINDAETASEVKAALDTLANQGEVSDYLNVTPADRIFIAEQVLDARDDLEKDRTNYLGDSSRSDTLTGTEAKKYLDKTEVGLAVTAAITARDKAIDEVNALTLASDLEVIAKALLLVGHESLTGTWDGTNGTVTANDTEVADAFITSLEFDDSDKITPQFRSIADIRKAIDAALAN
ncbi:hypothetical protein [Ureibacillus thermosphaericus]|uniref:hypothetical protein n=1 Tax=Ureibacillus thermosphaericus TaxID=51173 RepID=UPI0030C94257